MEKPLSSHGRIMYLLIPSDDPEVSSKFYGNVFDWKMRVTDEGLSFSDTGGGISGRFVTDRAAAPDPGFIFYIMVQDAKATEAAIEKEGGRVMMISDPEAFDMLGHFRDPYGNMMGFYEMKEGDPG